VRAVDEDLKTSLHVGAEHDRLEVAEVLRARRAMSWSW
jgi:hypothetical protein